MLKLRAIGFALVLISAVLGIQQNTLAQTAGIAGVAEPLGTVDMLSLPQAPVRTKIKVIRKPLPRFENETKPVATIDETVPDTIGTEAGPAPQVAAGLVKNFEGIAASGLEPPDPHMAVGPSDVLLATNAGLRVYNKNGTAITGLVDPSSFFGVPTAFEIQSDPKVLYDAQSGRFFGVWIAFDQQANTGALFVAVSTTSSAAGSFVRYQINEPGNLPDYPGLGICGDKLILTANDFRFSGFRFVFNGAVAFAIRKSQLTAGTTASFNRFANVQLSGGAGQAFTIQPAHSLSVTNTCHMVALRQSTSIQLYRITGLPPSATLTTGTAPALATAVSTPPDAIQSGSSTLVNTNDSRLLDATYRSVNGGSIWTASTTGCQFAGVSGTFSCINVVELSGVNGSAPTRRQQIVFGGANSFSYFPALRTDSGNNMTVVFSRSSGSNFPSLRYTTHLNSAALNTLESSALLVAGSAPYTATRWGDYQGAALDPSDNRSIWIYGEYKRTGSNLWYTRWGQTRVP
ncbi:MAG: hypothetical protein H7Y22_02850 [Gemmatimonadaceae bacterium]|nr:hypothetical protein [Gloeobacterales cyanobacterium ES-bin-141]